MHPPLVPQIWFPSAPPLRPVMAAPERRRPAGAPTAAPRCLLFSSSPLGPSSRPSPGRARGRSRASPPRALSASSTARRAGRRPIPPPLLLGGLAIPAPAPGLDQPGPLYRLAPAEPRPHASLEAPAQCGKEGRKPASVPTGRSPAHARPGSRTMFGRHPGSVLSPAAAFRCCIARSWHAFLLKF
ncbi:hypothetical protein NDU88_004690 [Pleurodeles waltl]|uniref:Uncharacterized protein n=1 Tax=Pleurodeles waltl TaxID=8319 RepID=A0AAV7T8H0_PLEWA|nr:hypothetical protein NDU88_004690 [Pleurodeles waltl]